ncbi:membrane-spanning 4-domains subfamily A member 4A-like isoform X1 [Pimephales promelas]|uniref:membrane-spanning 4-domains subfamily A member 4A-like isoform X1 n=2 Tax=Pimephales promelas TaxID=90988 RepID=UPI001955945B|nr:membrane-spanning 4-domains subfamily A member 4A-like isoform X1 [Pimephales promelas]
METSKVISMDKATVVIQVNPQVAQHTVICEDGQENGGVYHTFLKAQPKALGTVQIMTGVMVFLFGIVRTADVFNFPAVSLFSGITYWGSLVNISAGALSVAAQSKPSPCVMNSSLVMNVLSAVTAGLAVLLISLEIGLGSETSKYQSCPTTYGRTEGILCLKFERYDLGILGILLVFSILQFIISICISAFACKASSNSGSTVVHVALTGDTESQ